MGGGGNIHNIHLILSRFQACIIRFIAQVPEVEAQLALCVMLANSFEKWDSKKGEQSGINWLTESLFNANSVAFTSFILNNVIHSEVS